jgi:predicted dehydrogenase
LTVATANGVSGVHAARKFGFAATTTDAGAVFDDPDVAAVVVSTRHDTHADFVCRAFAAGKHVFVEKPLALTLEELAAIEAARAAARQQGNEPLLMVGFNRRFSPLVHHLQRLLEACPGPRAMTMTINAGKIPAGHWTQDSETGGGRIVGEACHFVDLMRCLAESPLTTATLQRMAGTTRDTAVITLGFANGSVGAVNYLANGSKAYPKERLEVFADGRVAVIDNFRSLCGYGWPGFRRQRLWRQDKGQRDCATAFVRAVADGNACPIPYEQVVEIAAAMIRLDTEGRA